MKGVRYCGLTQLTKSSCERFARPSMYSQVKVLSTAVAPDEDSRFSTNTQHQMSRQENVQYVQSLAVLGSTGPSWRLMLGLRAWTLVPREAPSR